MLYHNYFLDFLQGWAILCKFYFQFPSSCLLDEAQDPPGMVPTSTPYIYKVFETIYMLWMGRWVHHHAPTTILVSPRI